MISLESILTRSWQTRGLLACILWPIAQLFGVLAALRRLAYRAGLLRQHKMPVPLIMVGNLTVGGTGKTPLTIWLIEALRAAGRVPGVISRGHGGQHEGTFEVQASDAAINVGDEPLLIVQRTGAALFVGRDRPAVARALLAAHPQVNVLISDDGLQHYALGRDIEIVVFDARGAGNGWLLPAGPLREPMTRRRDFTVINAPLGLEPKPLPHDLSPTMRMTLGGNFALPLLATPTDRVQRQPLSELRGRRILAAAGIGHPARFFAMLEAAGLQCSTMPLPDHFDFARNPFVEVDADLILMTEKDAVKCRQIAALREDGRLHYVPVDAQLDGPLAELILEKLRGYSPA